MGCRPPERYWSLSAAAGYSCNEADIADGILAAVESVHFENRIVFHWDDIEWDYYWYHWVHLV